MNHNDFIWDFDRLGILLRSWLVSELALPALDAAKQKSVDENPWFTDYHINMAIEAIVRNYLDKNLLRKWLSTYPEPQCDAAKNMAVVMAGNIPLVGFHDYLCVLASGNNAWVKLSSKDAYLLPAVHDLLCSFAPKWSECVRFVKEVPTQAQGIIATGGDVAADYFTKHFAHIPQVIRRHRISIAVLSENASESQIALLKQDMFLYFGLGCRSVCRLFMPEGFDMTKITELSANMPVQASHQGFRNAYLRQKALFRMQGQEYYDGTWFLLQETDNSCPPVATVYFTMYKHIDEVLAFIEQHAGRLQCVVGTHKIIKKSSNFGSAQAPQLWDYADGVDIMTL